MSSATHTHTRIPVCVTIAFGDALPTTSAHDDPDSELRSVCADALVGYKAMTALSLSVASLPAEDPRHAAAYAATDLLRCDWKKSYQRACALVPQTFDGLRAKSALLAAHVVRDELDGVVGGALAQLAASLTDDVLYGPGPDLDHQP